MTNLDSVLKSRDIGMGKTCKLKDVSFKCMTKFTTNKKKIKNKKIKKKKKKKKYKKIKKN